MIEVPEDLVSVDGPTSGHTCSLRGLFLLVAPFLSNEGDASCGGGKLSTPPNQKNAVTLRESETPTSDE